MNRRDLQRLSNIRIREAQALFEAGEYSGAYYLAGYAVECALKACFARSVRRYDFPDRDGAGKVFTHKPRELIKIVKLTEELSEAEHHNLRFLRRMVFGLQVERGEPLQHLDERRGGGPHRRNRKKKGRSAPMDQAILVTPDVGAGSEVLKALDSAKINPSVVLLMASSDYEDWRLVISSPALDQTHLLKAYEQVTEALQGRFIDTMPPILVLPTKDRFIRDLRKIFSTKIRIGPPSVTRLGGQTIGNRFIIDAYVYRVR